MSANTKIRPVESITVVISILNLIAILYLGRQNNIQQQELEKYKLGLVAARLEILYDTQDATVRIINTGNVKAQYVQIWLEVPEKFDVGELTGWFNSGKRNREMPAGNYYQVEYIVESLLPGIDFGLDIFGRTDNTENPLSTEIYIQVTCDNCFESTVYP